MIQPMSKNSELYKKIQSWIEDGKAENLRYNLNLFGEEHGAEAQMKLALTAQKVADDMRGSNAIPSLADTIIAQQSHKISRYGKNAFPLSEKQVDAIVRDIF